VIEVSGMAEFRMSAFSHLFSDAEETREDPAERPFH
jgi:hypothetical protein